MFFRHMLRANNVKSTSAIKIARSDPAATPLCTSHGRRERRIGPSKNLTRIDVMEKLMEYRPSPTKPNWRSFLFATFCMLLTLAANDFRLPAGVFADPFHQGEYFAALPAISASNPGFTPLTIHGALDFLPGLLGIAIAGEHSHFFPTWLIYRLLNCFAAVMFMVLVYGATKIKGANPAMVLALALVAPFVVGYRDAVLLLSVLFYFLIQYRQNQQGTAILLESCLGITVAFGLFWSFDRGITAAVSLGAACLIHAYRTRTYLLALILFPVFTIAFGYLSPQFALGNYWKNVEILTKTSAQWSLGWQISAVVLTGFLGLLNLVVIGNLWVAFARAKAFSRHFANIVFLTIFSFLSFKIGTNRADNQHILFGLMGPLFAAMYCYYGQPVVKNDRWLKGALLVLYLATVGVTLTIGYQTKVAFIPVAALAAFALIPIVFRGSNLLLANRLVAASLAIPLLAAIFSVSKGVYAGQYGWLSHVNVLPRNADMVTEGVRWASGELRRSGARCVFDFSNNGVINGITGLPSCSRFSYPVYANRNFEGELIESLKNKRPPAIVYSSTIWSFAIDGKPMYTRLPDLDKFLKTTYPTERCSLEYCIRYTDNK